MSTQPQPTGNSTARIEVIGGQPVVFVGDRMFALPTVNTGNSRMSPTETPTMETNVKHVPDPASLTTAAPGASFGHSRASTQTPFAGLDLPTLKAQQALKKQELRTVEQTEVLQASQRGEAWRATMIEQKRCLIVELDAIRKQITALETENPTPVQTSSFAAPVGAIPYSSTTPAMLPQLQQPLPPAVYSFPTPNPYAPMMMYPFPGYPATDLTAFAPASATAPHSPGSGSRRSHAVEIKPPREENKKQAASALDPKSPTYEPASKSTSGQGITPPTPSQPKRSPWSEQHLPELDKQEYRALSQKPSLSSIDTTDFFPTNTHEHSSTRVAPRANEAKPSSKENTVIPSTPEKHWPASPWNESHSDRSRNNEPAPKLTSWPEAFGKQPSFSSLRREAAGPAANVVLGRATPGLSNAPKSASNSNSFLRTAPILRPGKEENWPFSSEPVAHVPTTYQEGYQAGYNHVGIPDSPEVLQGFIQGLLHFLSDESKKRQAESSAADLYQQTMASRPPSLRALLAGSTPHDSAVSMTFNHNNDLLATQENIRSAKIHSAGDKFRNSAYSPGGITGSTSAKYDYIHEGIQEPRQRDVSGIHVFNPSTMMPEKNMPGFYSGYQNVEQGMDKKAQEQAIPSRTNSLSMSGAARQSFGSQIQNRGYGMSLSKQRTQPSPLDLSSGKFNGQAGPATRSMADYRLSGLDGAMDDLAEMINDTNLQDQRPSVDKRPNEASVPVEYEEKTSSCFKASSGKGKQKATSSPLKPAGITRDTTTSPSTNPAGSPKKSGEHSPAKAKLEQVTNKFRRVKKDDPRTMSPEDRVKRSEKWRQRFQQLKRTEQEEIEAYTKANRT